MLQERISELGSGILKYRGNKVKLIGFMSTERLEDYYNKKIDCHFSEGIYDNRELNWGKIKDNALFIILNDKNQVIAKHQFEVLDKNIIEYKDDKNNNRSKTYYIRKCRYTGIYNFIARERLVIDGKATSFEDNRLFNTLEELKKFFSDSFSSEIEYFS